MTTRRITLGKPASRPAINLTPIMDVVFILVIFFLLAAQFVRPAEQKLALAPATAVPQSQTLLDAPRRLVITATGYQLDGNAHTAETLSAALAQDTQKPLLVITAPDAPYQALVTALDAANAAGLVQVAVRAGKEDGQ